VAEETLEATLNVMLWVTGFVPEMLTVPGVRVIPLVELPVRLRLTVPVKPFWGVTVSWVLTLLPGATVRLLLFRKW